MTTPVETDVVLSVRDLHVRLSDDAGRTAHAVRGVSFDLLRGETLGIVGESGSGKSTLGLALTRLSTATSRAELTGTVVFEGSDILASSPRHLRAIRGDRIAYVFQSPDAALDPTQTIGSQISSVLRVHEQLSRRAATARAVELLQGVGIPEPAAALRRYPHQFSGGMKQRAVIAIALANRPSILIADEPTSALDVLVQARIMELLAGLREELGMAMIFISHDFRVVSRLADRILVLNAGRIAEIGPTRDVLERPRHRYTEGLLRAVPRIDPAGRDAKLATIPSPTTGSASEVGCSFALRCGHVTESCWTGLPALAIVSDGRSHVHACWNPAGQDD